MLKRQWMSSLLCAVWIMVLFSAGAFAQSDKGTIGGFIKDASGAVVPGARVVLTNEATGEAYQATADTQGHYTVTNLTAGDYSLTAEVKGFKKYVSSHNTLGANTTLDLDAPMTIGAMTEEVTVSATAEVLQTESGAVQAEITGKQVSDQELNGRNPLYMGSQSVCFDAIRFAIPLQQLWLYIWRTSLDSEGGYGQVPEQVLFLCERRLDSLSLL